MGLMVDFITQKILETPRVTLFYLLSVISITILSSLEIINPLSIYFNTKLIFFKGEIWRIFTCFLYFGPISFDLLFHIFFLLRYFRALEAEIYRGCSIKFIKILGLSGAILILLSSYFHVVFLGTALTFSVVYIWSRKNPHAVMNFLGMLNFHAPLMPFILTLFSILASGEIPLSDILGILAGHISILFEEIFPMLFFDNNESILIPH